MSRYHRCLQQCFFPEHLDQILAAAVKTNLVYQDTFFVSRFIEACCRFRRMDCAGEVFTGMIEPNSFVYNVMIKGFILCSSPLESLRLYIDMCRRRVSPTCYTFSSLVKACAATERGGDFGECVHGRILKVGLATQLHTQTALIDFYANHGLLSESRKVFDEMFERDNFSWTTMMNIHLRFGDKYSAKSLFQSVPEKSIVAWNTMIIGLARLGDLETAVSMFTSMPERNLVSWTSMISCYSQNKAFKEAVETFVGMMSTGTITPDEVTMTAAISACAHVGALTVGEASHLHLIENKINLSVYTGSALIDMYAKCGDLTKSLMVFFKLKNKNLFCWNSVIDGLAFHGQAEKALTMLALMEQVESFKPNGVTFVSILTACTHAGLISSGKIMFQTMIETHCIAPEIEHYGCMVDLLSRAGFLQEALDLISTMRIEPNAIVWGAILSGCSIHRNLEIGRIVAAKIAELVEPDDSSGYHLLSVNMFAGFDQWSEVDRVRETMRNESIQKKSPGCSWIEIDGTVYEFTVSDDLQPVMGLTKQD